MTQPIITDLEMATSVIGGHIEVLPASTNRDIDTAFANLVQKRADAILVSPGPLFGNRQGNSTFGEVPEGGHFCTLVSASA